MKNVYLLPGGYIDEHDELHREVELTSLSGREEEELAGSSSLADTSCLTTLLSRCVRRLGTLSPVSEDVARLLLVADRQYLLLKLRAATFGDQVQATVQCPWADCRKKVDIDFSLQDIPVQESQEKGPFHTLTLSPEAAVRGEQAAIHREVVLRLPNGEDEEQVSPIVTNDEAGALTLLLARCIQSIGPLRDPGFELVRWLSPLARREIEQYMTTVAPRVDLTLEARCPECERAFTLPFALLVFFINELQTSREQLYREVHYLAYYYHWSEQEIMTMPRVKRRKYIATLAEELERLNHAS